MKMVSDEFLRALLWEYPKEIKREKILKEKLKIARRNRKALDKFLRTLNDIDKKYENYQNIELWRKEVSHYIKYFKRKKEEKKDSNLVELIKDLSPIPRGYIDKIFRGELGLYDFKEMIKKGYNKQDIKEIYLLAGKEKEYKIFLSNYKMIYKNNIPKFNLIQKNEKIPKIALDNRGNPYHTNLEEHLEDLRNQGKL